MSLDLLPADLLLKMFHHLPFRDRVRLCGVNRLFKEISENSINKMRSLEINDDLVAYSVSTLSFASLLESCSSTLESIDISNQLCDSRSIVSAVLNALAEFEYPNLKLLKIRFNNGQQTKRLISRSRNLSSIILHLIREFEFPEGIVFENLEKLIIATEHYPEINLSPTLHPLVGIVPNLKHLSIKAEVTFSVQEFNQLLASTPYLEELHLDVYCSDNIFDDIKVAIPTWRLPKLITLYVTLNWSNIPSSILHHFPAAFPRLESFTLRHMIEEIDDQALMALTQLKHLKELRLPDMEMTKDELAKMITALPSITVLQINLIEKQALPALSQLGHLRELYLMGMKMTTAQIIDVVTSLPSLSILGIAALDVNYMQSNMELNRFLMFTAVSFRQNLEIRLEKMEVNVGSSHLGRFAAELEEIEKSLGPVVIMDDAFVQSIRYKR